MFAALSEVTEQTIAPISFKLAITVAGPFKTRGDSEKCVVSPFIHQIETVVLDVNILDRIDCGQEGHRSFLVLYALVFFL